MSNDKSAEERQEDSLRRWISDFDDEVALEIGRLVLAFSHLEYTFITLIAERIGINDRSNFTKALLMTADNTFVENVQLFRALGRTPDATKDRIELEKVVADAAINASRKRNEIVHAWYLDVGDDEKIFMYWKMKPTAKYGYSTRAGPLHANMVRDALDQVLAVFPVIQELPEHQKIYEKGE